MGTNVVSGSATAIVINTGNHTYFGSLSKTLIGKRAETSFDKGVNKVSFFIDQVYAYHGTTGILINGLTKHDWMEAFLFAVAIAVG